MFYSIKGKLIHMESGITVLECGGVGFKCFTSMYTQRSMPKVGDDVMLYTHLNVREDALDLFGFSSKDELNCFKLLTSVSGVGPKAALAILSELSPEQLALCVSSGDVKSITRAQGVGPKIAQRIIVELKDKILSIGSSQDINLKPESSGFSSAGNISQAISALTVLGYQPGESAKVLSGADPSMSVEELIRTALKSFGGNI